ncbi:MAG: aminodeoxychorismate/anthranilate synthase component II [Planctomycetota bacterium]|nr:MAG: aminodeoxychorismate/anthranilate synthase component II [Planctomycetota bacterium]REJ97123.1 MAG: aminodeoxychorismate/anthranilate synthase component II [Planctomycetota bacterium]REK27932.1 MAG: aminodeoxychorismate/anthranilate synthase component II [Planctomycetota bacterium]REK42264.1 MAG: aminodeoxychorismate/anthranilate synthase component II [Planctomycetota bacterium]
MIFLLDNYDSFTYNLVQRLGEIDPALELVVKRNDQIRPEEVLELGPSHVIISPGPCTPNEAGVSLELVRTVSTKVPLLGVCLGHQSIAQAYGAKIVRAGRLMHGKTDEISHDEQGLFAGLANPLTATRYHSLLIEPDTLSDEFDVTAWSDPPTGEREIMGIRHKELPIFGVQFHPESFLTGEGTTLLENFLRVG